MKILRHRLHDDAGTPLRYVASPNHGGEMTPKYLVMHYTAGQNAESSIRWLTNPTARASAHLVIGLDGSVTQLVPFNQVAWHAGPSQWEGFSGMNHHSIGIELDNPGRLDQKGGRWCAWFGTNYEDSQIMVACHKNETAECGWHIFTPEQLAATLEVSRLLVGKYRLRDVVGHDDISPGRKSDPGPAFPMESFRAHLFGRAEDEPPAYRTRTALNIRTGPGTQHDLLPASPLPRSTRLEILDERGAWRLVNVQEGERPQDGEGVQGWVHGAYIERLP